MDGNSTDQSIALNLATSFSNLQCLTIPLHWFQLPKESRQSLQPSESGGAASSLNLDYSCLDKSSKSSEMYLAKRSEELDNVITDIRAMREAKAAENEKLRKEIDELEKEVLEKRSAVDKEEERLNQLDDPSR